MRIGVYADGGGTATVAWQLQYARNGGGWVNVGTASTGVRAVGSGNFTDQANTTQQLVTGSTYLATNYGMSQTGINTAASYSYGVTNTADLEYSLQFRSLDLTAGDLITFRLYSATLAANTTVPTLPGYAAVKVQAGGVVILPTGYSPWLWVSTNFLVD